MFYLSRLLYVLAVVFFASTANAGDYTDDALYRVKDSVIRFYYNHSHAPSWLSEEAAVEIIKRSAERWSPCGITLEFAGTTTDTPNPKDGKSIIGWGIFLSQLGLSEMVVREGAIVEADMQISSRKNRTELAVESTISHEFGHWVGILGHSKKIGSLMALEADQWNKERVDLDHSDIQQCFLANHPALAVALAK